MFKLTKLRKILLMCVTLVLFALMSQTAWAKGTPWDITPESDADADGGTLTIRVYLKVGNLEAPVVATINVAGGMTKEAKALKIEEVLDLSTNLDAAIDPAGSNTVKVEVSESSAFSDISRIEIDDSKTGEKLTKVKDDPVGSVQYFTAYFDLRDSGTTSGGEAVLQIGDALPMVVTSTNGKSALQIEQDLITAFNSAYESTDYTAVLRNGGIEVQAVPCPEGLRAGSDDGGLSWKMGMGERRAAVPALSEWGLLVLLALLLATGIWVAIRRRKQVTA